MWKQIKYAPWTVKKYTGVSQSLAIIPTGALYSCAIRRREGRKKLVSAVPLWRLEKGILSSRWIWCLLGTRLSKQPLLVPQQVVRLCWEGLCPALDRGIAIGILALRMPACFRFAHHRPESSSHGEMEQWGVTGVSRLTRGFIAPFYSEAFSMHAHSSKRALALSPHKLNTSLKSSMQNSS